VFARELETSASADLRQACTFGLTMANIVQWEPYRDYGWRRTLLAAASSGTKRLALLRLQRASRLRAAVTACFGWKGRAFEEQ
jgi:hypothetical protein